MPTNGPTRRGVLAGVAGGSLVPVATAGTAQEADGLVISILGTNSPVASGDVLEVSAEIENGGSEAVETDAELIVGHNPTLVDSQPVDLEPGESTTIELTFETATVSNDQEFPVWVTAGDNADRTDVLVYADDPPLEVAILDTNDPVTSGSTLQVMAELSNRGTSPIEQEVVLIVGHDPQQVDSTSVSLEGGETETVSLEFVTADVNNDQEFPVRVESADDADERSVLVYADGPAIDVSITGTNDPVDAGEVLEVTTALENTGESTATQDVALIVGHDPQRVDSASVTLAAGQTGTLTLEFETATVRNTQEFPARVEAGDSADEVTVEVIGTEDDGGGSDVDVTFTSCTRAEVTGSFEDGDSVAASTGFYDDANGEPLYGNTIMEDWVEFGNHVDAPYSGTIVFEIGDGSGVSETGDGVHVDVGDYGELGTVLTGITAPEDYATATITYSNPEAESCLNEIEDGAGDGGALEVSITGTNAPVQAGEYLEVTATLENAGDETVSQDVALIVGHDPQEVDSTTESLEGGASTTVSLGYETYAAAQTTEFPVRVESEDDSDQVTVEVIVTEGDLEAEQTEAQADEDEGLEAEAEEEPQTDDDDGLEADDADDEADDADDEADAEPTTDDAGGDAETESADGSADEPGTEPDEEPEPEPDADEEPEPDAEQEADSTDEPADAENGAAAEEETDDGTDAEGSLSALLGIGR